MTTTSVLITCSPEALNTSLNALAFCEELAKQSAINHVFFYQQGVLQANGMIAPGTGDIHLPSRWAALAKQYDFPLHVCVGAATKRGIVDETQAEELGLAQSTLHAGFEQVGLGEFFTALHQSDKMVQF